MLLGRAGYLSAMAGVRVISVGFVIVERWQGHERGFRYEVKVVGNYLVSAR